MKRSILFCFLSFVAPLCDTYAGLCFAAEVPAQNVLMVGWDGSRLARIEGLLKSGKLPVLAALVRQGSFVKVNIKHTKTDTKAGWSEILTGYDASVNRVFSNKNYGAIPPGLTLFERLRGKFGKNITTVMLTGKINNLGIRGPHQICLNCISRLEGTNAKSEWWDESKLAPTVNGEPRKLGDRDGEPYFNAVKAIDFYQNRLSASKNVLKAAKKVFSEIKGKHFFAFIHFEEPDEQGHLYGEHSKEYTKGILENDKNMGKLLQHLEKLGMRKNLKIFVMGDHGFDILGSGRKDDLEHSTDAARLTFLATNTPGCREDGDRRDLAPTVLKLFGISLAAIVPPLQGNPYF